MNKEYLLGAGGIALPFLLSGILKKKTTGAEIVGLGFITIPRYGSADISVTWKNTSSTTKRLYCAISWKEPDGNVIDAPVKAKDFASGGTETSTWAGWLCGKIGSYQCRAGVWDTYPYPGTSEEHRLADTGWRKVAEVAEEVVGAVIVKALINSTQWYP